MLVFIDTNIFLDFYRVRGRQGDLSILKRIDEHHDRIITTSQVEMEFKKNRQRVILEAHDLLKTPTWGAPNLPAFLASSRQSSGLASGRKRLEKQMKTLRERVPRMLENPARSDPVYQTAQRLFKAEEDVNLSRSKKDRLSVRRRAWKRFMLGYPPRKAKDTEAGDAINWEWLVFCAAKAGVGVVVVSRDGDYGVRHGKKSYINDWLKQEFKERVGRKEIVLTERLAEGFRLAGIDVTEKEQQSEEEFLEEQRRLAVTRSDPARALTRAFLLETASPDLARIAALNQQNLSRMFSEVGGEKLAGFAKLARETMEPEREKLAGFAKLLGETMEAEGEKLARSLRSIEGENLGRMELKANEESPGEKESDGESGEQEG